MVIYVDALTLQEFSFPCIGLILQDSPNPFHPSNLSTGILLPIANIDIVVKLKYIAGGEYNTRPDFITLKIPRRMQRID